MRGAGAVVRGVDNERKAAEERPMRRPWQRSSARRQRRLPKGQGPTRRPEPRPTQGAGEVPRSHGSGRAEAKEAAEGKAAERCRGRRRGQSGCRGKAVAVRRAAAESHAEADARLAQARAAKAMEACPCFRPGVCGCFGRAALRSTFALAFSSTLALSAASAAALRSAAAFAAAAALASVAALRSTSALAFSSTLALSAASAAALRSAAAFAAAAALASVAALRSTSALAFSSTLALSAASAAALRSAAAFAAAASLGFRCGSALDLCSGLLFDPCPFGSLRRRLALGGRIRRRGSLGFRCFGGCGVPRLAGDDRRPDRCGGRGAALRRIVGSRRMAPGKLSRKPRQRLLEVGFVAVVRRLAAERLRRAAGLEEQDGLQGGRTKPASSRPAETVINRGRRHLCPSHRPRSRLAGAKVLLRNG